MADAKAPTKKAAPKKTVKAELSIQDQLKSKRAELMDFRKSNAAGELVNPRAITAVKKDIARIMTKLNADKGKEA